MTAVHRRSQKLRKWQGLYFLNLSLFLRCNGSAAEKLIFLVKYLRYKVKYAGFLSFNLIAHILHAFFYK